MLSWVINTVLCQVFLRAGQQYLLILITKGKLSLFFLTDFNQMKYLFSTELE